MLRKTNKATISKDLEGSGISAIDSELPTACVIDAMSFVQKLDSNHKMFSKISTALFRKVMVEGNPYQRTDVIFDKYHSVSIKNPERMKRGEENAPAFANFHIKKIVNGKNSSRSHRIKVL